MEKIDLVVLYVNSEDKNWQELYAQYAPVSEDVQINGKQRFRSNPHFKYWFRGVEKYVPWINNVFLVVQSHSQVPDWIDTKKVKIVLHEDFMPKECLPVFNSQAIEMFLGNIQELSEHFLYSNDDSYFVGDMKPEDFFTDDDKVKTFFSHCKYGAEETMPLWKRSIINSGMVTNKQETEELKKEGLYIAPMHGIRPYLKSKIKVVYEQYFQIIFDSISRFREKKNLTVYLYDFYLRKAGLTFDKTYTFSYFSSLAPVSLICTSIINPQKYKTICINDTLETADKQRIEIITQYFQSQFPNRSKYELDILN